MIGEGAPLKGAPTDGLPATTTVAQAALELEALVRLGAARDLIEYVLAGAVVHQPWTAGARGLIERAAFLLEMAA